jgi:predicted AAA+ superfamily ATPase
MQEMQIKLATLVTLNEDDIIDEDVGRITVIPAWKFLLLEATKKSFEII